MNEYIAGQFFQTITMVLLAVCFLLIITASFYDIWIARRQKAIRNQTKLLYKIRPHVTILVYAENSAATIVACLASILKNRYRQYDIVVVNNRSTDTTRQELLLFQGSHPQARLYVYNKRKKETVSTALKQAYKKSQHGDIIFTLQSNNMISKTFLKESVAHFMALSPLKQNTALLFNQGVDSSPSIIGSVRYFGHVGQQLLHKVLSSLHLIRLPIDNNTVQGAMYHSRSFIKSTSGRLSYVYDSQLTISARLTRYSLFSKKRTIAALLRFYIVGIIVTCYITYSLLMAASLQNTALLLFGWMLIVAWFFAAVWADDTSKITNKLRLTFVLPSLYFFLYLLLASEVIFRITKPVIVLLQAAVHSVKEFYASQPAPIADW